MGINLNFFTPVSYLNNDNGYFTRLKEMADDYFYYGGARAYIEDSSGFSSKARLVECKASSWMTALKVASLAIPIIPLGMLCIKAVVRWRQEFTILNPQPLKLGESPRILTPQKKHFSFDAAAQRNRYVEQFARAGIDYSRATPLQKHVAFFTDRSGNLTQDSMRQGFERLHFGKITAAIVSFFIFRGLTSSTGTTNGVLSLKDIHKGKHPSDTGAFTERGGIDFQKVDQLRLFAKTHPDLLTASELAQMRAVNKKRDESVAGGWMGSIASQGEFDLTLSLFGDRFIVDDYGNAIPAITLGRLHTLYTDGPVLFEEVAG